MEAGAYSFLGLTIGSGPARCQVMDQCFVCGDHEDGTSIEGTHCCFRCLERGGELVITSGYGEGMGVMEAAYLEILCAT